MNTYGYKMLILDTHGNKLHFSVDETPSQFHAVMSAEEWAIQGGVEVDWIEILETDDPREMGVWDSRNG